MKKIILSLTVAASAALLVSCGPGTLSSVLSGTTSSSTSTGTSAVATGAADLLSNVLGSFLGTNKLTQKELVGTWSYTGTDCVFETDNLLMKAGGSVAAAEVESQANQQLQKIGIKPGSCSFTFKDDNTFSANLGGKKVSGTYTLDEQNKKLSFKMLMGLSTMTAQAARNGNKLSLLFESDKLLQVASLAGSLSGNTALKTLSELAGKYDGMLLGLQMQK